MPAATVTVSGCGRASSSVLARHERGLELGHERVDLLVGVRRVGDHAQQPADRDHLAHPADPAAQDALRRRLHRAGDLLGLHLRELLARPSTSAPSSTSQSSSLPSVMDRPHFGIPSLLIMRAARLPVVSRMAAAIVSGVGT